MPTQNDKERNPLIRLADSFVDDVMSSSDAEILVEFRESCGDPVDHAAAMYRFIENAVIRTNKSRLAAAKVGVAFSKKPLRLVKPIVDIAEARRCLRSVEIISNSQFPVTIAARNEKELSDADVLSMYEDLIELGIVFAQDSKVSKT